MSRFPVVCAFGGFPFPFLFGCKDIIRVPRGPTYSLPLQRKIQEAEEAKKRLAALKVRAAKRTAAGASTGSGKLPSGSMSSLSGSVSRAGSTPIAAITAGGAGANDSSHVVKGSQPTAAESEPGAAKDSAADRGAVAGTLQHHHHLPCRARSTWVRFARVSLPRMGVVAGFRGARIPSTTRALFYDTHSGAF